MKLVKASKGKMSKIESLKMLRILSSGIKLTGKVADMMGYEVPVKDEVTKEIPQERVNINYAIDPETGDLYIYTEPSTGAGNIVGTNNAFSSSALQTKLLELAGKPADFDTKGKTQVVFDVADATEVDGEEFFKVTFSKLIEGGEVTEKEEEEEEL